MEGRAYTDLEVWQHSRSLANQVYELTRSFPKEEIFGLTSQMRRSAVSIPSNIAEGCGRQHGTDTLQFLHIARGSLYELETQLLISNDQGYINQEDIDTSLEQITTCKKLLNGFINYYRTLSAK
jgi:four helix bundle protein